MKMDSIRDPIDLAIFIDLTLEAKTHKKEKKMQNMNYIVQVLMHSKFNTCINKSLIREFN